MSFLDYSQYQPKGFEGEVATSAPKHVRMGYNPSTTVSIPIGRVVVRATQDDIAARLPAAVTGETVIGINVYAGGLEKNPDGTSATKPLQTMNLLQKGEVFMLVEVAVTPDSPVFYRAIANPSPGANDAIGRLRTDADTSRAVALPNARFLETGAAGDLVKVAFNFV